MKKNEIIEYLYDNNTHADISIEDMAEDLAEPERKNEIPCDGCKHKGVWDEEVDLGYHSPCTDCEESSNYEV